MPVWTALERQVQPSCRGDISNGHVNVLDDIRANWRFDDGREGMSQAGGLAIGRHDGHGWMGHHLGGEMGIQDLLPTEPL